MSIYFFFTRIHWLTSNSFDRYHKRTKSNP